jgi:integrase
MPRRKLTKSALDGLPKPTKDIVYWDTGSPGFGVKVTPKGRKVFIVLYRTAGAGSRLRKYTIGPYGRVTLHQARIAAQNVHAARLAGRDPASEKSEAKRRMVVDRVEEILEAFIAQHVSQNRSGREVSRMLQREIGSAWGSRSIHEISKRDVIDVVSAIEQRGAPIAANKTLKAVRTFFRWCVGRALLNQSPADGIPMPAKEIPRDRVLSDDELSNVLAAARRMGGPYGAIVEFLALTGQRREEVAHASWVEFDFEKRLWSIPNSRTKNGRAHIVHLSDQSIAVLKRAPKRGLFPFSESGVRPFQAFSRAKRQLDMESDVNNWCLHDLRRTCVSGMARLGVAPHVADKILNHQAGTISGVAAVYQRHDFLSERKEALERWGTYVADIVDSRIGRPRCTIRAAA